MNRTHGITLLEMMFVVSLSMLLALMTMRALAVSRETGGKARDRAQLAILAQRELDALLASRAFAELPGEWLVDAEGPATSATLAITPAPHGLSELRLTLRRKSPEGAQVVALATLVEVTR